MGPNRCVYNLVVIVYTVHIEYRGQQRHVTAHPYIYILQRLLLYGCGGGGRVRGGVGEDDTVYDFRWNRDGTVFYDVDKVNNLRLYKVLCILWLIARIK